MPTPQLTQRLIRAKEELTALKTAHKRSTTLIKRSSQILEVETQGATGIKILEITVNFTSDSTENPFLTIFPKRSEYGFFYPVASGIFYSQDGLIATGKFYTFFSSSRSAYHFKIATIGNISSITYTVSSAT